MLVNGPNGLNYTIQVPIILNGWSLIWICLNKVLDLIVCYPIHLLLQSNALVKLFPKINLKNYQKIHIGHHLTSLFTLRLDLEQDLLLWKNK